VITAIPAKQSALFADITAESGINFIHKGKTILLILNGDPYSL